MVNMHKVIEEVNKRKREQKIKPLDEITQIMRGWQGAYNLDTGEIELGSTERATPTTLWHEFIHKYLFEKESFESTIGWDNIAKKIERQLFGIINDVPYAWTLPPKQAKYVAPKHRTLEEKGLSKDIVSEEFGLGITTYKSGEVKNYKVSSLKVGATIKKELIPQLENISSVEIIPTIGYWKGTKEPSTQVVLKGDYEGNKQRIIDYKDKYKQDAVMVFKYKETGWTGVTINKLSEEDLPKLNLDALTYDFTHNKIMVFGEDLNIETLRKKVRELGGNMTTYKLGVEFI